MKGIVLAGGSGTRLYPVTKAMSKQMVPIYDKPMIYYPMSVLMLAGIRDILIISTERDLPNFKELFKDGSELGLNIEYKVQDPKAFGVVEFDENGKVISLEEKPEHPKSKYAVPGLYFYDNTVIEKAKGLKPSARGELEITDLNRLYMEEGTLKVNLFGRGMAWLDTGTHASMLQASNFVEAVQNTQGTYIACLEEIAYRKGWITAEKVMNLAKPLMKTGYGKYLVDIVEEIESKKFLEEIAATAN